MASAVTAVVNIGARGRSHRHISTEVSPLDIEKSKLELELTTRFPSEDEIVFDQVLGVLMINGVWRNRRVVYTKSAMIFAKPESAFRSENVIGSATEIFDSIPFFEIDSVRALNDEPDDEPVLTSQSETNNCVENHTNCHNNHEPSERAPVSSDGEDRDEEIPECTEAAEDTKQPVARKTMIRYVNTLEIRTNIDGFNAGRVYFIQAQSGNQSRTMVEDMLKFTAAAKEYFERPSALERFRHKVKTIYDSGKVQGFVGFLILSNFASNIFESQLNGHLENPDGSPNGTAYILDVLDKWFTAMFTVELCVNLTANEWNKFVKDSWSMFDLFIVSMSLISLADVPVPSSIIRLLRAFRVIRLFGKIRAVKQIIVAVTKSLFPVMNAFIIMFAAVAIYAILGVAFFADDDPRNFGRFDRSFYGMFLILSGDSWLDGFSELDEYGELQAMPTIFICSFRLIVEFILLQVSVAVLLDNFVQASAQMEREEKDHIFEQKKKTEVRHPLDSLLAHIAKQYLDDEDLSACLKDYFKELDENGDGWLGFKEFCRQMRRLEVDPPIHLNMSDFDVMTQGGTLCNEHGEISAEYFDLAMRAQLKLFLQRHASSLMMPGTEGLDDAMEAQLQALKDVVSGQQRSQEAIAVACTSVVDLHTKVSDVHAAIVRAQKELRARRQASILINAGASQTKCWVDQICAPEDRFGYDEVPTATDDEVEYEACCGNGSQDENYFVENGEVEGEFATSAHEEIDARQAGALDGPTSVNGSEPRSPRSPANNFYVRQRVCFQELHVSFHAPTPSHDSLDRHSARRTDAVWDRPPRLPPDRGWGGRKLSFHPRSSRPSESEPQEDDPAVPAAPATPTLSGPHFSSTSSGRRGFAGLASGFASGLRTALRRAGAYSDGHRTGEGGQSGGERTAGSGWGWRQRHSFEGSGDSLTSPAEKAALLDDLDGPMPFQSGRGGSSPTPIPTSSVLHNGRRRAC